MSFLVAMNARTSIAFDFTRRIAEGIGLHLPPGTRSHSVGSLRARSISASGRTICVSGERCRGLRTQLGLSREALSERSHGPDALSVATIKRAELGHPIYPASAAALARILGTTLEDLLRSESEPAASGSQSSGQAAVAVLPFRVIDGDSESARFAEGLAADVIHRVSWFWFPVISRASSFRVALETEAPSDIGVQLGADYLVEGNVRVSDKRVRVVTSLIRATDGHQVWAQSYESSLADVLTLQAELATDIGSEIGATLLAIEGARYAATSSHDLSGWALGLRSAWHLHRLNIADNLEARTCAERALVLDRLLVLPRYVIVISHQQELVNQWTKDARATLQQMFAAGVEFERHAPGDPMMLVATAYTSVARGEREEAITRLEAALDRDPNSVRGHSLYGQVLAMRGQADQALHELQLARTLSPRDPALWTVLLATALAEFVAERYEQAACAAKQAVLERPEAPFNYGVLAAAQAQAGDLAAAKRTVQTLRERGATLTARAVQPIIGSTDASIAERFVDGLRRAGIDSGS
jgi:TolB-like protein